MTNLDFACMESAQGMVSGEGTKSDKENAATKALGVLMENGPYGMMVYLESKGSGVWRHYRQELIRLCGKELIREYLTRGDVPPPAGEAAFGAVVDWLQVLAQDLDRYLFAKRLWQQTLTYTRYQAKALEDEPEVQPQS